MERERERESWRSSSLSCRQPANSRGMGDALERRREERRPLREVSLGRTEAK